MPTTVWVVSVHYEDDDPAVYGPYTERQALTVAGRIDNEATMATDRSGKSYHPRGVVQAIAWELSRYDAFLTIEERRTARADVRAVNS